MKKFTFCTNPSDEVQPAIIDVNNVAPIDFVGNLCVSKLKIPRNTLPVALVPPMNYEFTAEEKIKIDRIGYTPTEMYYLIFSHQVIVPSARQNCNGNTDQLYRTNINDWAVYTGTSQNFVLTDENCFTARLITFWMPDKPRWKKLENGNFALTNEDKPIYAWSGENFRLKEFDYYKVLDQQTTMYGALIRNIYDQFIMDTTALVATAPADLYTFTTPIIALSQWLTKVNGLYSMHSPHVSIDENITFSSSPGAEFLYTEMDMEVIRADVTYNASFRSTAPTGEMPHSFNHLIDMSASYNFRNFNQTELLFPVNHIAIQCLDLNYEPEDISINTVDLEGTINPSHMYFLKTFLISTRGGLSDFLYIEDNTTTNTIEVNSPRITRLQFRFLWIDSNQIVHNLELWRDNVITLQLVLYPADFSEPNKRPKITFVS